MAVERVAECRWNRRPDVGGTGGRMAWNAQVNIRVRVALEDLVRRSASPIDQLIEKAVRGLATIVDLLSTGNECSRHGRFLHSQFGSTRSSLPGTPPGLCRSPRAPVVIAPPAGVVRQCRATFRRTDRLRPTMRLSLDEETPKDPTMTRQATSRAAEVPEGLDAVGLDAAGPARR